MVDYLVVALRILRWLGRGFAGLRRRNGTRDIDAHAIDRATAKAREFCAIVFDIKKTMPELELGQRSAITAGPRNTDRLAAGGDPDRGAVASGHRTAPQRRQAREQGGGMVAPHRRQAHGPAAAGRGGVTAQTTAAARPAVAAHHPGPKGPCTHRRSRRNSARFPR